MTPPEQARDHGDVDQTLLFTVDPGTHSATITDLLVSDDGAGVVTVGMDKRVRWWDPDQIEDAKYGADVKPLTMLGRIGPGADGAVDAAAIHSPTGIVVTAVQSNGSGFPGGTLGRGRFGGPVRSLIWRSRPTGCTWSLQRQPLTEPHRM
jgi:hypothetical protein